MHLVNGHAAATVSVQDRGVLYGQSLFETIAVVDRQALLLEAHLRRLKAGCERLFIPLDVNALRADVQQLCAMYTDATFVARVSQTMGEGGRGYADPEHAKGTRIASALPFPNYHQKQRSKGIELGLVKLKLAAQPALAGLKHSNRLEQLLARREWQVGWDEALLCDQQGNVIEGTQSNVFVVQGGELKTPDLSACGVAGIVREKILSLTDELGIRAATVRLSLADIETADEVFLSNSLIGVWPVKRFLDTQYSTFKTSHKLLQELLNNDAVPPL